jgi:NADPH2 dehydrogenase
VHSQVRDAHPNFAYIHVVEPRLDGIIDSDVTDENRAHSNEALRKAWGDRTYIAAGGMDGVAASKMVEKYGGMVAFGRHFISNVSCIFGDQLSHFLNTDCSPISLCA